MPCSQKQLIANRKNAQKSTGPKTPEGKAVVSTNAFKHGLTSSDDMVIRTALASENKNEYEQLFTALKHELRPVTLFQYHLVQRITNCLWRSRRVNKAETASINQRINLIDPDTYSNTDDLTEQDCLNNVISARSIPFREDSVLLLIYEMRLDRQLNSAFNLLKKLQTESSPPSALELLEDNLI